MSDTNSPSAVLLAVFRKACVCYTVILLFLCLILTAVSEGTAAAVSPLNFLLVFPFAVCFASANYIDKKTRLSGFIKFLLHFILTVGGFFFFLLLPISYGNSESNSFLLLCFFAVCYLIVYGTILLFRKRWKKEFESEKTYTSQFSAKDKSKDRLNHIKKK